MSNVTNVVTFFFLIDKSLCQLKLFIIKSNKFKYSIYK